MWYMSHTEVGLIFYNSHTHTHTHIRPPWSYPSNHFFKRIVYVLYCNTALIFLLVVIQFMIEHHEILILYDFRMVFVAKWAMTIYWCWCHTRVPFTAGLSIFIICARTKQQQQNVPPADKKGSEICISDQGWEVTRNNCEIRFSLQKEKTHYHKHRTQNQKFTFLIFDYETMVRTKG